MSYLLRPLAQADLAAIADYTFEQWGADQEELYLRMFDRTFTALAKNPMLGRSFDVVAPGLRKLLAGQHIVLYFLHEDTVDIVRVLHHSMDIESHLFDV